MACALPAVSSAGPSAPESEAAFQVQVSAFLAGQARGLDTAAFRLGLERRIWVRERADSLQLAKGRLLMLAGAWNEASVCLAKVRAPSPEALAWLGECLARKGDPYGAADCYRRAAAALPAGHRKVLDLWKRYVDLRPDDADARRKLADAYAGSGQMQAAALLYLQGSIPVAPDLAGRKVEVERLLQAGQVRAAGDLLAKPLTPTPATAGDWRDLAILFGRCRFWSNAAEAWDSAWKLEPGRGEFRDSLLSLLAFQGRKGEYRAALLRADSLQPDPERKFALAQAFLSDGDKAQGYAYLKQALEAQPGNPRYRALLPRAVEDDSAVLAQLPRLQEEVDQAGGASLEQMLLLARGLSLSHRPLEAAPRWLALFQAAPKRLEGRRDALADMAAAHGREYAPAIASLAPAYLAMEKDPDIARAALASLLDLDRLDQARDLAAQVLETYPGQGNLVVTVALRLREKGRAAEARELLEGIMSQGGTAEAAFHLGELCFRAGEFGEALAHFDDARGTRPEVHFYLAECYAAQRDYGQAATEYEAYARSQPKSTPAMQDRLAQLYRLAKEPRKEIQYLESLRKSRPADPALGERLADLYLSQGDTLHARSWLERLATKSDCPVEARLRLGQLLLAKGEPEAAEKQLRRVVERDRGRVEAWQALAACGKARGNWRTALEAHRAAFALDSQNLGLALGLAELLKASRQDSALAETYRRILRLDPANGVANLYLARQAARDQRYVAAADAFARALDAPASPFRAEATLWAEYGDCLVQAGRMADGGRACQKALDLGYRDMRLLLDRARAYRGEGQKDMAESILSYLMSEYPGEYLPVLWAGKFAEEDGNPLQALQYYQRVAKLAPQMQGQIPKVAEARIDGAAGGRIKSSAH